MSAVHVSSESAAIDASTSYRSFQPSPFFVLDEVDGALGASVSSCRVRSVDRSADLLPRFTDNTNVGRVARYVQSRTEQGDFQCAGPPFLDPTFAADPASVDRARRCIVITHKQLMFESSSALVGIYREAGSKTLTLDLTQYAGNA